MNSEVMKILGQRFRDARKKKKITIAKMGDLCCFNKSSIEHWEGGVYKYGIRNLAIAFTLLSNYGLTIDEFVSGLPIPLEDVEQAFILKDDLMKIREFKWTLKQDARKQKQEQELVAKKRKKVEKNSSLSNSYAICKIYGDEVMWFSRRGIVKHDFPKTQTKVNVFERDMHKAKRFDSIEEAREFINVNDMRIVRWIYD